MSADAPRFPPLNTPGWLALATIGALAVAFCVRLWPEWTGNPDLSHGLFAPVLFILLLREGRRRGPVRHHADTLGWTLLRAGALAVSLALVALAGIYAAAVDWSHALVGFSLALALSALLLGALLWLSSERARVLPLNWTTFVAAGIWSLWALGVGAVISGHFSGWNFGFTTGGWGGMLVAGIIIAIMYLGLVMSIAEMSPALPHTGAAYSFARTSMGPWGGFVTGLFENVEYVLTPAVIVSSRLPMIESYLSR